MRLPNWLRYFQRRTPQTFLPVVLVTGCSSGIGLALARRLEAHREYRVVITGRHESMEFLRASFREDERFWVRALDVTVASEREALMAEIYEEWGGVNILVNNAGLAYRAVVEHMTETDENRQLATNYLGPMGLIRLVLPSMRILGRGKIINVSSVSGMLAMPTMASYSASKHALEGASEALWHEMRPLGIDVILIQPGFINSSSFERVRFSAQSHPDRDQVIYRDYYENMAPFIGRLMRLSWATPESVADLILKTIKTENPPLWIPATLDALLFYYLRRMLPRRWLLPFLSACLPKGRRWANDYTNRRGAHRERRLRDRGDRRSG